MNLPGPLRFPSDPIALCRDAVSGLPAAQSLAEIAEEVRRHRDFALLCHVSPDGDALGSQVALSLGIRSLGKEVRVYCPGEYPEKFQPLFPPGLIEVRRSHEKPPEPVEVCFLVDTGEPDRAGPLKDFLLGSGHRRICIDHHPPGKGLLDRGSFDRQIVLTEAPSTGNIVLGLLDMLGVDLSPAIVQALWVALATDTGWFRFPNTSGWALRDAARLVEKGVDTEGLYQRVYADFSLARARVLGEVLSGLRAELGGRLVLSSLPRAVYQAAGISLADLDGMVDHLKSVRGAQLVAFVVELEPNLCKVSLRGLGEARVEAIARQFGGGGHPRAAGYRFSGSLEGAVSALVRRAGEEIDAAGEGLLACGGPEEGGPGESSLA